MFKTISPLFDIVKAKRNILWSSAFRYGSLTTTIWREMSRKREMSRSFFAGIITKTIYATNSASPTLFSQYFHFYRFFIAISTIFNSTSFYLFFTQLHASLKTIILQSVMRYIHLWNDQTIIVITRAQRS